MAQKLQIITASLDAVNQLRLAMSIFGGHGVIEDFSSLPRLYRDAAVNELWEGPRIVLLSQIHRDLHQVKSWYPPTNFVSNLLKGGDTAMFSLLEKEVVELMDCPDLTQNGAATAEICRQWDSFCHQLFHAYPDLAQAEVETEL